MLSSALPSNLLSRLTIAFVITLLVTGCTTLDVSDSGTDSYIDSSIDAEQTWRERQIELSAIKYWQLTGRLAVSNGEDAWNVNLEWQQRDEDYQIILNGPFGTGKVKLIGNADGVLLKDADDQTFYADTPEMLLYEQTGMYMPVAGLRYWVMGLASPAQKKKPKLDNLGRLAYLEEANWQVKFKRYTQVSGIDLPRKVFILKHANELDVRLVVDNWKLGAF
jgi:outer membrane lipoprotein LolB